MIRAVVFDVGETLIDERGMWERWADWLGVPRAFFLEESAGVIERGEHHRRVFELFRPGLDVAAAEAGRRAAGDEPGFRAGDFHPDAQRRLRAEAAKWIGSINSGNRYGSERVRERVRAKLFAKHKRLQRDAPGFRRR